MPRLESGERAVAPCAQNSMSQTPSSPEPARTNLKISLRPASPEDEHFLLKLYASTRQEEMALLNWPEGQKEAFLRMQFNARRRSYSSSYPGAQYRIILRGDSPAGAMIDFRDQNEVRLVDISLLPEHRNCGAGSHVIGGLIAESTRSGVPLRLSVLRGNRAARLYQRLGFVKIAEDEMYLQMECKPAG